MYGYILYIIWSRNSIKSNENIITRFLSNGNNNELFFKIGNANEFLFRVIFSTMHN